MNQQVAGTLWRKCSASILSFLLVFTLLGDLTDVGQAFAQETSDEETAIPNQSLTSWDDSSQILPSGVELDTDTSSGDQGLGPDESTEGDTDIPAEDPLDPLDEEADGVDEGESSGESPGDDADKDATSIGESVDVALAAAASSVTPLADERIIYWNPTTQPIKDPADDREIAPAGNDAYSGISARYPVLTWNRVQQLFSQGQGYTVVVMTTAVLGYSDGSTEIVPDTLTLDGSQYHPAITYWDQIPEELFLVPIDEDGSTQYTLNLKDISIDMPSDMTSIRIIGGGTVNSAYRSGGQLNIGQNVTIHGIIQTELEEFGESVDPATTSSPTISNPIRLTAVPTAGTKYEVYYSGLNDSQFYQAVNAIDASTSSVSDAMDYFTLNGRNTNSGWKLQHENAQSQTGQAENPKILELWRDYEYSAVYISGSRGTDSNFGGNCTFPVKTFARAKELIKSGDWVEGPRIIYVCDTVQISGDEEWSLADCAQYGTKVVVCPDPDVKHDPTGQMIRITPTMVNVPSGASLTLSDATLEYNQKTYTTSAIIGVEAGGALTINDGTLLTGGTEATAGDAVRAAATATNATTITINGGTITNRGYGISLINASNDKTKATLTMTGGTVTGIIQNAGSETYGVSGKYGAAVRLSGGTMTLSGGSITDNAAYIPTGGASRGAGVWLLNSDFTMTGGSVSNNTIVPYSSSTIYGGAIYADGAGTVDISGTAVLSGNKAGSNNYGSGGALYAGSAVTALKISGAVTFDSNTAMNYGGAIWAACPVDISGGTFTGNRSTYDGGTVYFSGSRTLEVSGGTFTGNTVTASNYNGGVFHIASGAAIIDGGTFTNNTAGYGGAIAGGSGTVSVFGGTFTNNTAGYGGALCQRGGTWTIGADTDGALSISGNTGTYHGGGIAHNGGNMLLKDHVSITGNTSATGGGLSAYNSGRTCISGSDVVFSNNVATTTQSNRGTTVSKGSNVYSATITEFVGGQYGHDTPTYGAVYIDVATVSTYQNYIDAGKMEFTNDEIFLNTAQSKLWALAEPDAGTNLPISVNVDVFNVGSIVVTPTKASYTTLEPVTYPAYDDVSGQTDAFAGGVLPYKTQLGGFNDNIILVGQGVYLDGMSGSDSDNNGTGPSDAVRTYAKAKEILAARIAEAKARPDTDPVEDLTFEPYIYICGEVPIGNESYQPAGDQTWELYAPDRDDHEIYEQPRDTTLLPEVRRFASYYGKLISLDAGKNLTLKDITINGVGERVSPQSTTATSAASGGVDASIDATDGTIFLQKDAIVANSYQHGIRLTGGNAQLNMSGNSLVKDNRNHGVYATGGADIALSDTAVASAEAVTTSGAISGRGAIYIQGLNTILPDASLTMTGKSAVKAGGYIGIIAGSGAIVDIGSGSTADAYPSVFASSGVGIVGQAGSTTNLLGYSTLECSSSNRSGTGYQGIGSALIGTGPTLNLRDDASVKGFLYGVGEQSGFNTTIGFFDRTSITNCNYGLYTPDITPSNGNMSATFSGESGISSCSTGVFLGRPASNSFGNHTVVFKDDSYVKTCSSSGIEDRATGSRITLQDNATVSDNSGYGVYIRRVEISRWRAGGVFSVEGDASVSNNRSMGIYTNDYSALYPLSCSVTLSGSATVSGNSNYGIYGAREAYISIGSGTSVVNNGSLIPSSILGRQVLLQYSATLDANATIDDEPDGTTDIHMSGSPHLITLTDTTAKGPDAYASGKFSIGYTSNYIGQRVIAPDAAGGVDDATDYFGLFVATYKPEGKGISKGTGDDATYIVVEAGNDVYIAGYGTTAGVAKGDDANNGSSAGSPVRTFARAKEILASRDIGGRIIICNYPVAPYDTRDSTSDLDWSFDEGGWFTNTEGESWQPVIARYKDYTGDLINIPYAPATPISFRNLTFDGNLAEIPNSVTGRAFFQGSNATVVMDEVQFQNFNAYVGFLVYCSAGVQNLSGITFKDNQLMARANYHGMVASLGTARTTLVDVTAQGNSLSTSYNYAGGLFSVASATASLSISGADISNNEMTYTNYYSVQQGGLINSYGGSLTLSDMLLTGNTVSGTGYTWKGPLMTIMPAYGATTVSMTGNSEITGNTISKTNTYYPCYGAVALVPSGSNTVNVTFSGGTIGDNTFTSSGVVLGAGISNEAPGSLRLSGTDLVDNVAPKASPDDAKGGALYLAGTSATYITNGNFTGNQAAQGAALYLTDTATVSLAGGTFTNNTTNADIPAGSTANRSKYAQMHVASPNFILRGGRAVIDGYIYLSQVQYPITLAGSIYQKNRLYNIDVETNTGTAANDFRKGSVVVKPDGEVIMTATSFHRYFSVDAPGYVLAKQSPNLVLKNYVFLDSTNTDQSPDGSTPDKAFVSFDSAVQYIVARGGDIKDTIFFISGPMNITDDETWSLADSKVDGVLTSSVVRYAGFSLTGQTYPAYAGDMFRVADGATLTFTDVEVMGRRDIDDFSGGTIVNVAQGGTFNLGQGASLSYNSSVVNADVSTNDSQGRGGAIFSNGVINISDNAFISNVSATRGGNALYLDVGGTLNMDGTPSVRDTGSAQSRDGEAGSERPNTYVSVTQDYRPATGTSLQISIENPYNGREVVHYPGGFTPTLDQQGYYTLDSNVGSLYSLGKRADASNILELQQKAVVYIDGVNGDDSLADSIAGSTPKKAVKTLRRAYEIMKVRESVNNGIGGGVIMVVNTVGFGTDGADAPTVTMENQTTSGKSVYTDGSGGADIETAGTVYIRRYSQPIAHVELGDDYDVASFTGALFKVSDGGSFAVSDMTIEGHSQAISGIKQYAAPAVEASSALVTVTGGTFTGNLVRLVKNNNAATSGTGGALEIELGTASIKTTTIAETSAATGSAIYQDGTLEMEGAFSIDGDIYLVGTGSQSAPASSRYITATALGMTNNGDSGKFNITVQDAYSTRQVVEFPAGTSVSADQRSRFNLDDATRAAYQLGNRTGADNILELQFRSAVYIDGVSGSDSNNGLTPDSACKTLEKAYSLLEQSEASVLYVVGTVTIDSSQTISTSYFVPNEYMEDGSDLPDNATRLTVNDVEIRRYSQPREAASLPGFTHESNLDALFDVTTGTFMVNSIVIDGHKDAREGTNVRPEMTADGLRAMAPLITTHGDNAMLQLNDDAVLRNNKNTSSSDFGGAVGNYGTTVFNNGTLIGNESFDAKGSGIYQHGTFVIDTISKNSLATGVLAAPGILEVQDPLQAEPLRQSIYLATENTGTEAIPSWTDYGISVSNPLSDDMTGSYALLVDMDHAQRARTVASFQMGAYEDTVANEKEHFTLGSTVPGNLKLEKSLTRTDTLELQDWRSVSVTKMWEIPSGSDIPESITFTLTNLNENGDTDVNREITVPYQEGAFEDTSAHVTGTVVLSSDSWSITINNINAYESADSGSGAYVDAIEYGLAEVRIGDVPIVEAHFIPTIEGDSTEGFSIQNDEIRYIRYHGNDNTSGTAPETQIVLYDGTGTVAGLDTDDPLARTDFVFAGWNTAADGGGTHYAVGSSILNMAQDVDLYAMWLKAEKISTKYDSSHPEELRNGDVLCYDVEISLPENTDDLVITDVIPENSAYVPGSVQVDSVPYDDEDVYDPDTGTITIAYGAAQKDIAITLEFQVMCTTSDSTTIENTAQLTYNGDTHDSNTTIDKVGSTYRVVYDGNASEDEILSGDVPIDAAWYFSDENATVLDEGNLAVADPIHPERSYSFLGWNTEADGSGTSYEPGALLPIAETDVTLYAQWVEAAKSSQQSDPDDPYLNAGEDIIYTITIRIPEAIDVATPVVVTDVVPVGLTYKADSATEGGVYTDVDRTVTWTFHGIEAGQTKTLVFTATADDPIQSGLEISNTAKLVIGEFETTTPAAKDTAGETAYIQYDGNGATAGDVPIDSSGYLAEVNLVTVLGNVGNGQPGSQPLSKTNADFVCWNTKADGTGTSYAAGGQLTLPIDRTVDNVTTLYAMWQSQPAKVSVNADGGETTDRGDTLRYTITLELPTESHGAVRVLDPVPNHTTLVAGSINSVTDRTGASVQGIVDSEGNVVWDIPNGLVKGTYTFEFSVTVDRDAPLDTTIRNIATVTVNDFDHPSTADERPVNDYAVMYDGNGATSGDAPASSKTILDTEVTVKDNVGNGSAGSEPLSKEGALFIGWNTEADGSGSTYVPGDVFVMQNADVTLHALWVGNEKTAEPVDSSALYPGGDLEYTIRVSTPVPGTFKVVDEIPSGTTYVEGSANEGGVYDAVANTVTWTFEDASAGTAKELKFRVTVSEDISVGIVIGNTATIMIGENSYNTTTTETTVSGYSTPTVTKEVSSTEISARNVLDYTIMIVNDGEEPTGRLIVRDYAPANTVLVNVGQGGVVGTNEAGTSGTGTHVTWLISSLGPGERYAVTMQVRVVDPLADGTEVRNIALHGRAPGDLPDDPTPEELNGVLDPVQTTNTVTSTVSSTPTPTPTPIPTSGSMPIPTSSPTPSPTATAGVKTGDTTNVFLCGAAILALITGGALCVRYGRKVTRGRGLRKH